MPSREPPAPPPADEHGRGMRSPHFPRQVSVGRAARVPDLRGATRPTGVLREVREGVPARRLAAAGIGADAAGVQPVPPRQPPFRGEGLRALVEVASRDVAGQPERFLLPNGPREAAAMVGVGIAREDHPADLASGLLALVAVVIGVYACAVVMMASGPAAAAWAAVFVATSWAAARALVRLLAASGTGARARGHFVALSREDSKRIAREAACTFGDLLRGDDCDTDAAFGSYHEVLVSLARFELAAKQAVAADRDRARLLLDDPLRSVAAQMAQDKAALAVAHRAAARAVADDLQAALHCRRGQDRATRPPKAT